MVHGDRDQLAHQRGGARHVDQLVLARATGQVDDPGRETRERVARLGAAGRLVIVIVVVATRAG